MIAAKKIYGKMSKDDGMRVLVKAHNNAVVLEKHLERQMARKENK